MAKPINLVIAEAVKVKPSIHLAQRNTRSLIVDDEQGPRTNTYSDGSDD